MNFPVVAKSVKAIEDFLADEEQMNEIKAKVNENFGGIVGVITNILGGMVTFLLNALLTLFSSHSSLIKWPSFSSTVNSRSLWEIILLKVYLRVAGCPRQV